MKLGLGLLALCVPQGGTSTPTSTVPMDMIMPSNPANCSNEAVQSDLKCSYFCWDTLTKEITIKRLSRPDISAPWASTDQTLSASFWIVDVRSVCNSSHDISALYVLGLEPGFRSVIERWSFAYLSNGLIRIARDEILDTEDWGIIRSLEPDPDGRFLLFLTRAGQNAPELHRLDYATGGVTSQMDVATVPQLAAAKSIFVHQHVAQGRQYHLYTYTRWGDGGQGEDDTIVLRDGDNDGIFDSPAVLTNADWEASGFQFDASWLGFCE